MQICHNTSVYSKAWETYLDKHFLAIFSLGLFVWGRVGFRAGRVQPCMEHSISNQFKVLFWELWPRARPAFVNRGCRHWLILQNKASWRPTKGPNQNFHLEETASHLHYDVISLTCITPLSQMFLILISMPQPSSLMCKALKNSNSTPSCWQVDICLCPQLSIFFKLFPAKIFIYVPVILY